MNKVKWFLFSLSSLLLFVTIALVLSFKEWFYGAGVLFSFSVLGFVIGMFLCRKDISRWFYQEKSRKLLTSIYLGVVLLFLLGGINFLAGEFAPRWDLSNKSEHSLSEFSKSVIKKLDADLTFIYMHVPGEAYKKQEVYVKRVIRKYEDESRYIRFKSVNAYKDLDLAKDYGFSSEQAALFIKYKGRKERIASDNEMAISNAIFRATSKAKKVIMVTGQGERNLFDDGINGLSSFRKELAKLFFQIQEIDLNKVNLASISGDMLFIVGPKFLYSDAKKKQIETFVKGGGSVLLALDPKEQHGLYSLTAKWGVEFSNTIIFDDQGERVGWGPQLAFAEPTPESRPVWGAMPQGKLSLHFIGSPLLAKDKENKLIVPLLSTSKDNESRVGLAKTSAKSGEGPFYLAYNITRKDNPGRTLVFGDSNFLANQFVYQNLNPFIVRAILGHLSKFEELKSLPSKESFSNPIILSRLNLALYFWFLVIPIPLVLFITSFALWFRRRNR